MRRDPSADRLPRKLRRLRLLSPKDYEGVELIVDDAIAYRMARIERTPLWRGAERRIPRPRKLRAPYV